jgi:hypothetical protein
LPLFAACRFAATLLPLSKCIALHVARLVAAAESIESCNLLFQIGFMYQPEDIFDIGMLHALPVTNGKN